MIARLIVSTYGLLDAFVPYDLREIPKSFPDRKWDPKDRCWRLPADLVNPLADALRAAGCTVYVTGKNGKPWTAGGTDHGTRSTPADGWADGMFTALGPDLQEAAFKALSKVLHPDTSTR